MAFCCHLLVRYGSDTPGLIAFLSSDVCLFKSAFYLKSFHYFLHSRHVIIKRNNICFGTNVNHGWLVPRMFLPQRSNKRSGMVFLGKA